MITLDDVMANAATPAFDFSVTDALRRESPLLRALPFDNIVNPVGGGATMTYSYGRLVTPAPAAFRALNQEYTAAEAKRQQVTVGLRPLGGKFNIDRVLARVGAAAASEVAFQFEQLTLSVRARFQTECIQGAVAGGVNGFDGLDTALAGTVTEIGAGVVTDWTNVVDANGAHNAIDKLDQLVSLVNGGATHILGNVDSLVKLKGIARRAGYYSRDKNDLGQTVEMFGNAILLDLQDNYLGNGHAIPTGNRTVGTAQTGITDLYAVRVGMDGFHGVSTVGQLIQTWQPDFTTSGAVKPGELEMGPVATVLHNTKGAAVLRNVKVR